MADVKFEFENGRRFGTVKGTFTKHANGVRIEVSHNLPPGRCVEYELAPNKDPDYNVLCVPDKEYRWCQTIDTTVPLGGAISPYVDPSPSDDPGTPRPFYFTDAEHLAFNDRFVDGPSRNAPAAGKTTWRAILSLCAVNDKKVSRITSVYYGFDIDGAGTVTEIAPTEAAEAQVNTHLGTLRGEFGAYTFS